MFALLPPPPIEDRLFVTLFGCLVSGLLYVHWIHQLGMRMLCGFVVAASLTSYFWICEPALVDEFGLHLSAGMDLAISFCFGVAISFISCSIGRASKGENPP